MSSSFASSIPAMSSNFTFGFSFFSSFGRISVFPLETVSLNALAKQYWRYGYWKWRMLRRFPGTLRWRQALPPVFVLGIMLLLVLSVWFTFARILLAAGIGFYLALLVGVSLPYARRHKDVRLSIGIPLAIATMHFSWGSGFIWSIFRSNG